MCDATRGLGVPGEVAQELARDASSVAVLVGVGEPEDLHLAGGMGAAVVGVAPVAAVLDPVAREDARRGLDVAFLERSYADRVQLEQLTSEVLARVVLGRVGAVEVDQHGGMDDRVVQHLVEASQGVLADDIAVARPPRELGVTVGRDVEVVLPELRHHLQHRPRRDQPSHQQPTSVVVHHPVAGPGARDLQLPQRRRPQVQVWPPVGQVVGRAVVRRGQLVVEPGTRTTGGAHLLRQRGRQGVGEPRDQVTVGLRQARASRASCQACSRPHARPGQGPPHSLLRRHRLRRPARGAKRPWTFPAPSPHDRLRWNRHRVSIFRKSQRSGDPWPPGGNLLVSSS